MSGPAAPRPPRWAVWVLRRIVSSADVRIISAEMDELYARWTVRVGPREARRRYLRQWRQYPWRALATKLRDRDHATDPNVRVAGPWLTAGDMILTARALAKAPTLTAAIVLTVGVGIGGCTTIFSLVDALYLRPLPYTEAERLAVIYTDAPPNRFPLSVADFQALQEQQTSFAGVAAAGGNRRTVLTTDGAELLSTLEGTPGLLDLWGIAPLDGRLPGRAEGLPDAAPTVAVTLGFARRHLGADATGRGVVGRTLNLDGEAYEVLAVLPSSLGPLAPTAEVVPTLRLGPPSRKGPFFLRVFGRLREGVAPEAAHAELRAVNDRLFPVWADSYQDRNASWGLQAVPEYLRGDTGSLVAVLMAAVGMVLLISLANATNLLVARVSARGRELAVRAALGASRGRIWGHLLTESLLLAAGGVTVGLVVARVGVAALPVVASGYLRRAGEASLSTTVVLFALLLSALSGLLFSLVPALHRRDPGGLSAALRSGGRGATAGRSRQRAQSVLVAAQVALVVPLLAGAFLLLTSFVHLQDVDPGFDVERLASMRVSLSPMAHPDGVRQRRFWDQALERIKALPEVAGAALSSERPPDNLEVLNNFDLEDRPTTPGDPVRLAAWVAAGPGYFDVMGIPLSEGRSFVPADLDDGAPPVIVVDEAWARRNYPGESAVGRRLYSGGQSTGPRTTVVGVVGSVPYEGVGVSEQGAIYAPSDNTFASPFLVVRTSGDPGRAAAAVQAELRRLDPTAPVTQLATGPDLFRDALTRPRHLTLLASLFATVALALAVVGIYGVTAYSVQQRRGDLAVRLALGSDPGAILGMTLWSGMRIATLGLLAGGFAALLVTRALAGLLYQVTPTDPGALLATAGLLLSVSALATLVPALRAVRVDPAAVLRQE